MSNEYVLRIRTDQKGWDLLILLRGMLWYICDNTSIMFIIIIDYLTSTENFANSVVIFYYAQNKELDASTLKYLA